MNSKVAQNRLAIGLLGLSACVLATLALPHLARGQEVSSAEAVASAGDSAETGNIIYSRSVHREVGAPYVPGVTQSVETGPTNTIIRSLDVGLAPLSDLEASGISASLEAPQTIVVQAVDIGTEPLTQSIGSGLNNEHGSSIVGGSISSAMGALGSALGTLQSVGGASQ